MVTAIDLIFYGSLSVISFDFIKNITLDSSVVSLNFPENMSTETLDQIIGILNTESYVDLVITTDCINLFGIKIPSVFLNIGIDEGMVEVLMFFDVKNINNDFDKGLNDLYDWSTSFQNEYNFDHFFCETDGVNSNEEYYFANERPPLLSGNCENNYLLSD